MNKGKLLVTSLIALGLTAVAQAQVSTPVETVTGGVTSSQTAWAGFAAISASAFVFAMIMKFSRKGTK